MADPFVVVGGDAAGLSAASKCKREAPDREVVVFEKGAWVSYAHCGTPYYVKGEVADLADLTSLSPADVADRGIDLRRRHEVTAVDTDAGTVTVRGPDGTFDQPYGALLVGTGARAVEGPFDLDPDGAFTLHGLDSAAAMRAYLRDPSEVDPAAVDGEAVDRERVAHNAALDPPERAAIVGGGYVGVELAEALSAYDLDVHLFQRPDRLLEPFGDAVSEQVVETLTDAGVTVHTGTAVDELLTTDAGDGHDRIAGVVADGTTYEVEFVAVGIGIRPNTELVADTPVECGDSGAIRVDEYGRTTAPDVYAAGDCAEDRHTVTGEAAWVPLGLTANRAGRAVGATVAGEPTPVGDVAGTAAVKAFDLECGRTGVLDHERARAAGFDPVSKTVDTRSRSGYYPGAAKTTVTLTADRASGRLLGGSIVGTDRAAIRIDTVATALDQGATVGEVERLDLAYAPPFSPVWDPVLVAAKVLNGAL